MPTGSDATDGHRLAAVEAGLGDFIGRNDRPAARAALAPF
jgi:hypothetical protein